MQKFSSHWKFISQHRTFRQHRAFRFMGCLLFGLLSGCAGTAPKPEMPPSVPELVSVEPEDNATVVKRNASIILIFSELLDSASLTINNEDTQCSGSIQVSTDNFRSCVRMNLVKFEDDGKKIILFPKGTYAAEARHQIRLTTEIKSKKGGALAKTVTTKPGFQTTWSQQIGTPGDDVGYAVAVDADGSIYVAGRTGSETCADQSGNTTALFLAKYAPNGFQHWIEQADFGQPVTAAALRWEKSGVVRLSAYSQEENRSTVILATYDAEGKKLFAKTLKFTGKPSGNGVAMDQEGSVYIPANDPFNLKKIRNTGVEIWNNQLASGLTFRAVAADSGNGLYATGSTNKKIGNKKSKTGSTVTVGEDIFLLKMYQAGSNRWSRTFGSPLNESGTALATKSDEAVAVAGFVPQAGSLTDVLSGTGNAFVAKYSSEGKQEWTYLFKAENTAESGNSGAEATLVLWTPEGDLLVGGFTEGLLQNQTHPGKPENPLSENPLSEDVFLAKLDAAGKLLWLRQFGTSKNERPLGAALGKEGQIYLTGFTEGRLDGGTHSGGKDIFLVQFNEKGEKQ